MKTYPKSVCCFWFSLLLVLASGARAAAQTRPITVAFSTKEAFAFPKQILGAQEEVWDLPYLSNEQWQEVSQAGVKVLRYPAGTTTDWFAWDNPEKGYWPGEWVKGRKKMMPDAFVALCKKYGFTPIISVNTASYGYPVEKTRINPTKLEDIRKGADYAARWVKDFNVDKKYGVKLWQIGNEGWTWLEPAQYALIVKEYSRAMRAVDPSITIIAIGMGSNWGPTYPEDYLKFAEDHDFGRKSRPHYVNAYEWTRTLLEQAGGAFDYISIHRYLNAKENNAETGGRQLFTDVLASRGLPDTLRLIKQFAPKVRVANTEWMVNFSWDPVHKGHFVEMGRAGVAAVTYDNSITFQFVSALVAADYLGSLIASGKVDFSVAHTLRDGVLRRWDPQRKVAISPALVMPAGIAMEFWNEHAGDEVVPVTMTGVPGYIVERVRTPFVAAYATRTEKSVSLILINKSPTATYRITVPDTVDGRAVKSVREHVVSAPSWDTSVRGGADGTVSPVVKTTTTLPVSALADYALKPSQLTCLELVF